MKCTRAQLRRALDQLCAMGAIERFRDTEGVEVYSPVPAFELENRSALAIYRPGGDAACSVPEER